MKCCEIKASDLDREITIEQEALVTDSVGGKTSTWSQYSTPWAKILPISGSERYWAMKLEANITHSILIRYDSGITPKMRIIYNGREFQIRAVINVEEKDVYLRLHCEEGKTN